MRSDRIKAYGAYVRVAQNNLRSIARNDCATGDPIVDQCLGDALRALSTIENRFRQLHRIATHTGLTIEPSKIKDKARV